MRLYGSSIFLPLCLICTSLSLPLSAQNAPGQLPDDAGELSDPDPGFIDPFAGNTSVMPELPESIQITNNGKLEFDIEKGTYLFTGNVLVQGDNELTMKAQRVLVNAKTETATLTKNVALLQDSVRNPDGTITQGVHLFADKALLDAKNKIVTLIGNVSIYQGPTLHLSLIHISEPTRPY